MKPIIFTGNRAGQVHRGEKTMTRRVIKPQPVWKDADGLMSAGWSYQASKTRQLNAWRDIEKFKTALVQFAPYKVGDLLWVRESFAFIDYSGIGWTELLFKTDGHEIFKGEKIKWQSPLFMPRWASRTTLEVTEVRAERLQEIGKDGRHAKDVLAEGITQQEIDQQAKWFHPDDSPAIAFAQTWNDVHRKHPENQWEANPWVWVIAFKRVSE